MRAFKVGDVYNAPMNNNWKYKITKLEDGYVHFYITKSTTGQQPGNWLCTTRDMENYVGDNSLVLLQYQVKLPDDLFTL